MPATGWLLGLAALLAPVASPGSSVEPQVINKPLVAHWTFDEGYGPDCRDSSGKGNDASPEVGRGAGLSRVEGVFGNALSFSGQHMLRIPGKPDFSGVTRLSLSAWVMPTAFERYNEIFRKEDGENRVLFSFQENMTVLSLGLNVNGYIECDAKIEPPQVMDGAWHHCAATFDGKVMRVYLDGKEIGSLPRPGPIAFLENRGAAAGCIGSSNGGECFQGSMDDLRIYREALTADEVALLHRNGLGALDRAGKEGKAELLAFYAPGKSFAETLANSRKKLAEQSLRLDPQVKKAFAAKLRASFPKEYGELTQWTHAEPAVYLLTRGNEFHLREIGRLIEMLVEYKPLTEAQWKRQSAEDLQRWKVAEAIEKPFDGLKARGDAAAFSPEWLDILFEVAPKIQWRPYVNEPVAPYVRPSTPATRDLSPAEARDALERDWLHQASGNPTPERIRSEIQWARELAARIRAHFPDRVDFAGELSELDRLAKQAEALRAPDRRLYFSVREVKRRILLRNPVVDFDRVLFVDMPFPAGSEWPHETRHRLGYMAVPGARLLILTGLSPEGRLTQLMPQPPFHGSFWRPDVSFDGRRVLFCFKPHNEKSFHLYEINADGSGLRQLTDGIFDDLDPIYLPDERHIMFCTTRAYTYVRCMPPTNAFILARLNLPRVVVNSPREDKPPERGIYLVSHSNEPEYLPSVLSDGRVIYTRWEYTDKPLWRAQSLWTMHADGTQANTFWGNQSVWPDLLTDARSIPGSRRVMFTGSAHHNRFGGSIGIVDPALGLNFPHGLTKVTADVAWPEVGNGPVDPIESPRYHASGGYAAYYSPYPLGERDFLVSAHRGGKFVLYLMDTDGNRELIYEGVHNVFHAIPLKARPRPPVIPEGVEWPTAQERNHPKPGMIYSGNVYEGAPAGLRGKAKFLRVLSIDPKTATYWHKRPYLSTGPVISGVQSDGVRRVFGTVRIEDDGSVAFEAPAGKALHFQLLDGEQRALQTMRSFVGLMPGERRGCLGCHELHSRTPGSYTQTLALARPAQKITPPPWGEDTVSYPRYVRPVLDKYCAKCHTGDGEGRKKVDMTARPGMLEFDETYWLFTGRPAWGAPYQPPKNPPPGFGIADMIMVEGFSQTDPVAYQTPKPMTKLSYKSRLIDIASSGKHHDLKVDPISRLKLILWVDNMCPYRGEEELREIADPEFQGVDWLAIRPRIRTAKQVVRPGPVD
jgi:hypothetical protein